MTILTPMSPQTFAPYLQKAITVYAKNNIDSGRWQEEGALARSQRDFNKLLPKGIATKNHYLFDIKENKFSPTLGFIWYAIAASDGYRYAFVYDIGIKPGYRRLGHATAAFKIMEAEVKKLGAASVGLHVFTHNQNAQALYKKLGYGVTGVNMLKHIDLDSTLVVDA